MELVGLNSEQKKAVEVVEGPLLILAGAGSGKTRVITYRIANLILNHKVYPNQILAVTFTNKAAEEMRSRCRSLLPEGNSEPFVRTFHSLCLYLLRREGKVLGLGNNFTVYDSDMQESLIKEILKSKDMDTKEFRPSSLSNIFSQAKDSFLTAEDYAKKKADDSYTKTIASIFLEYEKRKTLRNALDFGDLILKTVILFRDFPVILEKYQRLWKYIMVDEYQDTNKIQYHLVQSLSSLHKNLCVVGDDDQSIYSWRGADISNILNFKKDYPDAVVVKLEENYRSTKTIIETAAALISNNKQRTNKTLRTENPLGDKIKLTSYQNEMEEAEGIVQKIQMGVRKGQKYSNFAVFYRTNSQSRYFEESLRKRAIPYKIFGGFRFFDRKEVKDLIAYLSVVVNPVDSTSLLRIINSPPRGIGETTVSRLLSHSVNEGISLFECLGKAVPDIKKGTLQKLVSLHRMFDSAMEDLGKKTPSEIAYEVLEHSGYREFLENEGTEDSFSRLSNLNEFVNALKEFEENNPEATLEEYLANISLITSEDNTKDLPDYVILMTVHNAKGLEFQHVFMAGMEEGTFPHFLSIDSPDGLEEERRLAYVAITRARKNLEISFSRFTRKFGDVEARLPSQFLEELPSEFIDGEFTENRYGVRRPEFSPRAERFQRTEEKFETVQAKVGDGEYQVGTKVRHKVYGEGRILSVSGSGDNRKVEVRFGSHLDKKFLLAYTPLEIIS
ncbi:UvrD-helicase domain-containing protein [Leptospira sp. 2 VSF19]|uniref:DNA 3'-5' helicase n=1 Tax=Leptospira soteropolitanensis TaxID=2950025 RepID=A0AAW5VHV2_9LEPT|nr:UvrD-helicase domain-containing protein [Leptospira soteropolitanensis]MCW7492248.1 UvrD-helicase domain-containing protein [Leptospira soteropolitanensis]MCW7499830.1 UvrD-helicase domain-containing protein [Leptospira soteropolitanensis]MCW7522081.1 UvrD-helicase domain-containing protein [Leptospira soteropolitanensis]MCW7525935.1 UvrD-helicase domain-containing protein [Leptospira soteropolitanensis]MCW7529951.1 UvrD-helicase domain-containing protein [Leptospira soteropolitanensis]